MIEEAHGGHLLRVVILVDGGIVLGGKWPIQASGATFAAAEGSGADAASVAALRATDSAAAA